MSVRILKYALREGGATLLPTTLARTLSVGWQGTQLVVWGEGVVQDTSSIAERGTTSIVVVATGSEVPTGRGGIPAEFIGTAQRVTEDGSLYVLHAYRVWG
jgi:hypothetical protein